MTILIRRGNERKSALSASSLRTAQIGSPSERRKAGVSLLCGGILHNRCSSRDSSGFGLRLFGRLHPVISLLSAKME